jgi:CRP-like cAMP-binding protein
MAANFTYITDLPIFSPLSDAEETELMRNAVRKRVAPRTVILMEGQPVVFFAILTSGKAKSVLFRDDGREILLDFFVPGQFFGELNLSEDSNSPVTVIAVEECHLMLVSRKLMLNLIQRNGAFAFRFVGLMSQNVNRVQNRLRDLVYLRGEERVLKYVRDLGTQVGEPSPQGGTLIRETMSHQTIADSCGFSRETVSRMLSRLSKDKVLIRTSEGWWLRG